MQDWTKEIIEQICAGEIVQEGNIESGNRLALIIIDNAVEFALKHYAAWNSTLSQSQLRSNDAFFLILAQIENVRIPMVEANNIRTYHGIRNTLYHEGKLITVKPSVVTEYAKLAKTVLDKVLDYKLDDKGWKTEKNGIRKLLIEHKGRDIPEPVSYTKENLNGVLAVKMSLYTQTTLFNQLLLIINGLNSIFASEPTRRELVTSLALSNIAISSSNLNVAISKLRKSKRLQKGKLCLTNSAVRDLRKKFQF